VPADSITAEYLSEVARRGGPPEELIAVARQHIDLSLTSYGHDVLSRPVFLDHATITGLGEDLTALYAALVGIPDRLFGGDVAAFARAAGMTDVQVAAILSSGDAPPTTLGRADIYRDETGFYAMEVNLGSEIGGLDNAMLNRAFLTQPFVAEFVAAHRLTFVDSMVALAQTLRAECGFPAGTRPVVAATDWPPSFANTEEILRYSAAELDPLGIDFRPCHVGQLVPRDGRVWLDASPVDVVYRIFLIEDLLTPEGPDLINPVLRAAERGEVKIFTPLNASLYGSKAALALLSDEASRPCYSAAELAHLDRILPWTRMIRPGPVTVGGEQVDLAEYAAAEREDLLIKPTALHGGYGVVQGWLADPGEWKQQLQAAMDGPFVLQRRIRPLPEMFPAEGGPQPWVLGWGAFHGIDGYSGMIIRASLNPDVAVMNMTKAEVSGTCCFHQAQPGAPAA
jgi:hypothetical protein